MSALGKKQTSEDVKAMSALPPKADITKCDWNVRYVPKADIQEFATCIRLNLDYGTADCCLYNAAHGIRRNRLRVAHEPIHRRSEVQNTFSRLNN